MIAIAAKAVDRAHLRTMRQEHDDEAVPTLGALTPGEIFYHRLTMAKLDSIVLFATDMPK